MPYFIICGALAGALFMGACGSGEEVDFSTEKGYVPSPSDRVETILSGASKDSSHIVRLHVNDTIHISPEVSEFYRHRDFGSLWTGPDGISPRGQELIKILSSAEEDGLRAERYHIASIQKYMRPQSESHGPSADYSELQYMGELDVLMSETLLRYGKDLVQGTIDPNQQDLDWEIEHEKAPGVEILSRLAEGEDVHAVIDSFRPKFKYYSQLKGALKKYREIEASGGWSVIPEGETLEEGSTGTRVSALRSRILAEEDETETNFIAAGSRNDTIFDENLKEAVKHFQDRHGIEVDGKVGPATLRMLNTPVSHRVQDIRLNLDRWRWLPRDLGDFFVMVNVAGFEMAVIEEDSALLEMNVVVGTQGWQTPIFRDTIEHVVANPYWNVPVSIRNAEIIPLTKRDPNYLSRQNMQALKNGSVVPLSEVDHSNLEQYSFRQRPGPGNALGKFKFIFPNDMNIYLHDTPAQSYFSRTSRAFSHGCIRVEEPEELARLLLSRRADRGLDGLESIQASGTERWLKLDKPVPVYILYFTSWVGPDGSVRFHPDVYERNKRLHESLNAI